MSLIATVIELEQRAGASDEDRPAWLAERRGGVTATELRDLMVHKVAEPTLILRKLGRKPESDWTGPYAMWGKTREPVIGAEVERRWNIHSERRLFHAADEPRFMCSPDGIGVNFDELVTGSEVKTSAEDLTPWESLFMKLGYDLQCQWNMRVTGAERWMFAWEERHGLPGDFWPGEQHFHWIDRDERIIFNMEHRARDFLTNLDEVTAEPWIPPAEFDDELDTHAVNYLRFLQEENEARVAKEREWAEIWAAERSQTSALARITYTPARPGGTVQEIDYEAAEIADPGLFGTMKALAEEWAQHCEKFKKEVPVSSKARLRVTAPKPEIEKER